MNATGEFDQISIVTGRYPGLFGEYFQVEGIRTKIKLRRKFLGKCTGNSCADGFLQKQPNMITFLAAEFVSSLKVKGGKKTMEVLYYFQKPLICPSPKLRIRQICQVI